MKPDISFLQVLGCLSWYQVPKKNRKKLDRKSIQAILIGCSEDSLYKLWIPETKQAVVVRDVTFVWTAFPARDLYQNVNNEEAHLPDSTPERTPIREPPPDIQRVPIRVEQPAEKKGNAENTMNEEPEIIENGDQQPPKTLTTIPSITGSQIDALTYRPEMNKNYIEEDVSEEIEVTDGSRQYPIRERKQTTFYEPGATNVASSSSDEPMTVSEALNGNESVSWQKEMQLSGKLICNRFLQDLFLQENSTIKERGCTIQGQTCCSWLYGT